MTEPAPDPNAVAPSVRDLETIVSLSKRRGFIFPSSEIYGGINAVWDYGPLGVELKNNVKRAWWRAMVQSRDDIVGLDSGILMHPQIWVTSGHVAEFNDPMVECATCKRRYRVDEFAGRRGPRADRAPRPGDRRPPRAGLPERRRAAERAAPLQPDAQDVPRPGRGRGCRRLPAPRDGPGHLRQLPERARHGPQEDPLRDRPDRQGVPQRDQPRQLRLPDARVRADGDAVLRPPGDGRGPLRGLAPPAQGLVRGLRRGPRAAPLPRAPARRAGPLRQEGHRRRVPLPVRLEGARGDPQPGRLGPRPARQGVGREPGVLRPGDRGALHPLDHRDVGRRRPGGLHLPHRRVPGGGGPRREAGRARAPPGPRARTRSPSCRCSRSAPRSSRCASASRTT